MAPEDAFARALAGARRRLLLARGAEALVPGALAAVLAALLAHALGVSPWLALGPGLAAAAASLASAPLPARRLDEVLDLEGGLAAAGDAARKNSRTGLDLLLLRETARALRERSPFRPRSPSGAARAAALAAAALLAWTGGDLRGSAVPASREGGAILHRPPGGGEERPVPEVPRASAGAGDRGAAGVRSESAKPGGEAAPVPEPEREGTPAPGTLVPKPIAIESEEAARRRREAYIFEFPEEGGRAAPARRVPLREAAPRARAGAEAAIRRFAGPPEEAAFLGRYFERLVP